MLINTDSFQADVEQDSTRWTRGTVEVTLRGETKRVSATRYHYNNTITARGFVGRYKTSSKTWPARISQIRDAKGEIFEIVEFGRDDRDPKFRKENCIWFA